MSMRQFTFFHLLPAVTAIVALFSLTLFSGKVFAGQEEKAHAERRVIIEEDLTHPTFKTLTVGSCPEDRAGKEEEVNGNGEEVGWKASVNRCSRARLMYPRYKNYPWMNQLIAQSIILPMFAERLEEKPVRRGGEALYRGKLERVVRKGGEYGSIEKPPVIEFTARLAGYEKSSLSPAGVPRPELFGPYLQFSLMHELNQQYDAHPAGSSGAFIVVDTRARKILAFDDIIIPGQEKALEDLQRLAFHSWLKRERTLPSDAIRAHFADPSYAFRLNRNWRIAEGGLMFRFAKYEIGPRPFGMPEIFVEKERLRDIIQPAILEQIPGGQLTAGN